MDADWKDAEPGARAFLAEVVRAWMRARKRPVFLVALVLTLTAAIVTVRMKKLKLYPARIVVTFAEGQFSHASETDHRNARHQLRSEIMSTAFSDPRLLEVMKRFELLPDQRRLNPILALQTMRDRIELDIFLESVVADRHEAPRRFARVAMTFQAETPGTALAVARRLGELIFESEDGRQEDLARRDVQQAQAALVGTQREADRLRQQLALLEASAGPDAAQDVKHQVALLDLRRQMGVVRIRAGLQERRRAEAELRAGVQKSRGAMKYVVADAGFERDLVSRTELAVRTTALALLAMSFLAVLLLGVFDPRIYDEEDVRRAGLCALGAVPAWTTGKAEG